MLDVGGWIICLIVKGIIPQRGIIPKRKIIYEREIKYIVFYI